MIPNIVGLLTLVIATVITWFVDTRLGISATGFTLFFIVPVGAIILGGISSSGFLIGAHLTGGGVKHPYLKCFLAGVGFIFLSLYLNYASTYMDFDETTGSIEVNHSFRGVPVDQGIDKIIAALPADATAEKAELASAKLGSFGNFVRTRVASTQISFFSKRKKMPLPATGKVQVPFLNWVFFSIELAGAALVGLFIAFVIGDRKITQCETCRKRRTDHHLFRAPIDQLEAIQAEVEAAVITPAAFGAWVQGKKAVTCNEAAHVLGEMTQCPSCGEGYLVLKAKTLDEEGKVQEAEVLDRFLEKAKTDAALAPASKSAPDSMDAAAATTQVPQGTTGEPMPTPEPPAPKPPPPPPPPAGSPPG